MSSNHKVLMVCALPVLLLVLMGASCPTAPKPAPALCDLAPGISGPELGFTTEQRTFLPRQEPERVGKAYRALETREGWGRCTRDDVTRRSSQEAGTPLLSMVHLSDVHVVDAESPLRVEFLRHRRDLVLPKTEFQAGFRPQETLTAQVAESMMRQLNALGKGPVTGRKLELAVVTGDSGDNHQQNELTRFVDLLNGGELIRPDSGKTGYEGVQDLTPSPIFCEFWHPEDTSGVECGPQLGVECGPPGCQDKWKKTGFPSDHTDLLDQALVPFAATGLELPWFSTYGNHDRLIQGNFPIRAEPPTQHVMSDLAAGERKLIELPVHGDLQKLDVDEFVLEFLNPLDRSWNRFREWWTGPDARDVAPDEGRRLWTREDYVRTLLDNEGPYGPHGHGFAGVCAEDEDTRTTRTTSTACSRVERLYYAFDLTDEIRGIVLDTTNPNGLSGGSLDEPQLEWLETALQEVHSRYRSHHGRLIEQEGVEDKIVILFSHHNSQTLDNLIPGLEPLRLRVGWPHLERVLFRYPNLVLWLNGHTHFAKIIAHENPRLEGQGFWEVNTPSLIDFPQMSRVIELTRNPDDTLSIFSTLIDHAAPASAADTNDPVLRLAAISRELAANDPLLELATQIGTALDRNVELVVKAPFELSPAAAARTGG